MKIRPIIYIFALCICIVLIYYKAPLGHFTNEDDYYLDNVISDIAEKLPYVFLDPTIIAKSELFPFLLPQFGPVKFLYLALIEWITHGSFFRITIIALFEFLIAGVLLAYLVRCWMNNSAQGMIAGILFVIHPALVPGVVSYRTQGDLLVLCLMLLGLIYHWKFLEKEKPSYLIGVIFPGLIATWLHPLGLWFTGLVLLQSIIKRESNIFARIAGPFLTTVFTIFHLISLKEVGLPLPLHLPSLHQIPKIVLFALIRIGIDYPAQSSIVEILRQIGLTFTVVILILAIIKANKDHRTWLAIGMFMLGISNLLFIQANSIHGNTMQDSASFLTVCGFAAMISMMLNFKRPIIECTLFALATIVWSWMSINMNENIYSKGELIHHHSAMLGRIFDKLGDATDVYFIDAGGENSFWRIIYYSMVQEHGISHQARFQIFIQGRLYADNPELPVGTDQNGATTLEVTDRMTFIALNKEGTEIVDLTSQINAKKAMAEDVIRSERHFVPYWPLGHENLVELWSEGRNCSDLPKLSSEGSFKWYIEGRIERLHILAGILSSS